MFFDIFKDLCDRKGISPKRAADDMGLSNSITTKWKKTGATPNGETLNRIAEYFGVTTDYLLTGDEAKKAPAEGGEREITMDDFTYAMHNESGDLTDDDKDWLLSMARRIAEDNRKRNQNPD